MKVALIIIALISSIGGCQGEARLGVIPAGEARIGFSSREQLEKLIEKRWPLWAIRTFCIPERRCDSGWQNLVTDTDVVWQGELYPDAADFDKIEWYATTEDGRALEYSLNAHRGRDLWVIEICSEHYVAWPPDYSPDPSTERFVGHDRPDARTSKLAMKNVAVNFSGGHDIGKNDFGRPVVLMAAALGVKPKVFREAFSGVTPARGRGPTGAEQRANKAALMTVLAPLGVTNERMDEVADYYRFNLQRGELWPTKPATAHAIVEEGKVTAIVVTEPGSGYSTPPVANVEGMEATPLKVTLQFDKNLRKNGAIRSIELAPLEGERAK